jgi:catechol 2,3-dioxygenase-like lactoylglutathione lyase family enzyme
MFNGAHVIMYSRAADADRAFLRDQLGLASVDAGEGWLIFKLPPAEIAVHPTDDQPKHEFYFMCENLDATLARLRAAGAAVGKPPTDEGWGRLAEVGLPSGTTLSLYEPRHPVAYALE